jgi:hypothetical protein
VQVSTWCTFTGVSAVIYHNFCTVHWPVDYPDDFFVCYTSIPQPFLPTAHPSLLMAHDGTPQNFALRKGGTKYVATKNADICKSLNCID